MAASSCNDNKLAALISFPGVLLIDINPFVAFERGQRSLALDARVVLATEAELGTHPLGLRGSTAGVSGAP